jgi:hypothetical protein
MKRVLFGILLILSSFSAYWWVAVLFSIFGLFYFENLYEVIIVGLVIDLLYGSQFEILGFDLIFTIGMLVLFYWISKFKTKIFI